MAKQERKTFGDRQCGAGAERSKYFRSTMKVGIIDETLECMKHVQAAWESVLRADSDDASA